VHWEAILLQILVVDDDPLVRSAIRAWLNHRGFNVVVADGWELAERAQQVRPGLPVLLTSGYALETLAKHGQHREGSVVLTKPYRKAELAQRLREIISQAPALQPPPLG
jgi:CheY-like chemotaxis protein